MNADELLAKLKQQNRMRQQAYYARNKDAVNAKRRELYKVAKEVLNGIVVYNNKPLEVKESTIEENIIYNEVKEEPKTKPSNKNQLITYNDAVE